MKEYYSFKIPEPCHEDWNQMTPSAKGRFCSSCEKTVIDFTEMSSFEISNYLKENLHNGVCGRIYKSQLERIVVQIPAKMLLEPRLAHRFFALALLIVMGTTLFSCINESGNKQKIDAVEVMELEDADSLLLGVVPPPKAIIDSTKIKSYEYLNSDSSDEVVPITGGFSTAPPIPMPPVGMIVIEDEFKDGVPFTIVDTSPEFPDTPQYLSRDEKRVYFSSKVKDHIDKHFDTNIIRHKKDQLQKVSVRFTIDSSGNVADIETRANYKQYQDEAVRVLKLLPMFTSGQQRGNKIDVIYSLPIIFMTGSK
ncbi:MAG: hypothetical protein ABF274_08590 [Nonlabens sp.]|uniref:hypothetical protein n=1 Tax=Nonlabens sp. TaxID=1888209 RepID=UPI00321997BB